MGVTAQGELTNRALGERLVKLGRVKAGIGPVVAALKATATTMEELYRDQNIRDPLYHDVKAAIGPLDRLNIRVDEETNKLLKRMDDTPVNDPGTDPPRHDSEIANKLKRRLRSVG